MKLITIIPFSKLKLKLQILLTKYLVLKTLLQIVKLFLQQTILKAVNELKTNKQSRKKQKQTQNQMIANRPFKTAKKNQKRKHLLKRFYLIKILNQKMTHLKQMKKLLIISLQELDDEFLLKIIQLLQLNKNQTKKQSNNKHQHKRLLSLHKYQLKIPYRILKQTLYLRTISKPLCSLSFQSKRTSQRFKSCSITSLKEFNMYQY